MADTTILPRLKPETAERTALERELVEFLKTTGDREPLNTATFIIMYQGRILDLLKRMESLK